MNEYEEYTLREIDSAYASALSLPVIRCRAGGWASSSAWCESGFSESGFSLNEPNY